MGPLNEYERRFLDLTQQDLWLEKAAGGGAKPEYFAYTRILGSVAAPLASAVVTQAIITLQADSWFLWQYLSCGVTIPTTANLGGPEQITDGGNLQLQITLPGTSDDLLNVPSGMPGMPAALFTGSPIAAAAGIPYMFPIPVLLPPKTNVNISVAKLGAVAADNPDLTGAYLTIHGARIQVWEPGQ